MSEQNENRRKLLNSLAAGSGAVIAGKSLPESWSKPVVDSVMLPAHAQTSPSPCTPCLVAATYCVGGGNGSIEVAVAVDGTVTVTYSAFSSGPQTDNVDPCAGGAFSVSDTSGNNTVTISGTVPCGNVASIDIVETDGGGGSTPRTATQANCP